MEEVVNTLEVSDYISIGACLISVIAAIASIYNGTIMGQLSRQKN